MKLLPEPGQGHRKFTISVLALILSFILTAFGLVGGTEWVTAVGLIIGLYGGANVGEHFAARPHNPNPADPVTNVRADDDATITTTVNEEGAPDD